MDAAEIIGSPEIAGCRVNKFGTNMAGMARQGSIQGVSGVGTYAIGRRFATEQKAKTAASATPDFGFARLSLTDNELILIQMGRESSMQNFHLRDVLVRVPRTQVRSVELHRAAPLISKPLTVTFSNGDQWFLEARAGSKGGARKIASAFASSASN